MIPNCKYAPNAFFSKEFEEDKEFDAIPFKERTNLQTSQISNAIEMPSKTYIQKKRRPNLIFDIQFEEMNEKEFKKKEKFSYENDEEEFKIGERENLSIEKQFEEFNEISENSKEEISEKNDTCLFKFNQFESVKYEELSNESSLNTEIDFEETLKCNKRLSENEAGKIKEKAINTLIFEIYFEKQHKICLFRRDKHNRDGNLEFNIYEESSFKHLLKITKVERKFEFKTKNNENKFSNKCIVSLENPFFSNVYTLFKAAAAEKHKEELLRIERVNTSNYLIYLTNEAEEKSVNKRNDFKHFTTKAIKTKSKYVESIKNFTVEAINSKESVPNVQILEFGKLCDDVFSLVFFESFSLIEAASIAMSSFFT